MASTGNLPLELTSFVGRRSVLQRVKSALIDSRLVTVTGPGGVGKTRVARRAADEMRRLAPHGIWMVDLAGLSDPAFVSRAVMTALGLRDQSEQWPTSLLIDHLANRRLLLLLDNCEHLVSACAELAGALLNGVPDLHILTTSRQPLGVAGEHIVPVPPLSVPDNDRRYSLERLARYEAIELFCVRAQASTGSFRLTVQNQDAVMQLCQRLDGMPLAIELAAVRLRTVGLHLILERLSNRFSLLEDERAGSRTTHQTLMATIDWSHDLLNLGERDIFRRLAVFSGTFDVEAAEAICASADRPAAEVLRLLSSLVDKSLVSKEGTTVTARYRLHDTMREYALIKLEESGEHDSVYDRHVRHYSEMSRRMEADWFTARVIDWLLRTERDADNIRAALQRCLREDVDADVALNFVGCLWEYWVTRALGEGLQWLEAVLERRGGSDLARARALYARALVALHQPDHLRSIELLHLTVSFARRAHDPRMLVAALALLSGVHGLANQLEHAKATSVQLRALADAFRDPEYLYQAAAAEVIISGMEEDLARTRQAYAEVQALATESGEIWLRSWSAMNLALLLLRQGQLSEAETILKQALRHKYELDDRAGIVAVLEGLACHASGTRDWQRAASLLGAASTQHRELGIEEQVVVRPLLQMVEAQAIAALGSRAFQQAHARGTRLDRQAAVAYALGEQTATPKAKGAPEGGSRLGKREMQVARLAATGLSNKEIAGRLSVTERTVESHMTHIFDKLGLKRRTQLAIWLDDADTSE